MFLNNILNFLFPFTCAGCELEGILLCEKCESHISPVKPNVCPLCDIPAQSGEFCSNCARNLYLDGLFTAYQYTKNGPLARLLHFYKYDSLEAYAQPLQKLFTRQLFLIFAAYGPNALLTYVPMYPSKLKSRGFNQSETLAKSIGNPVKLLLKTLNSHAQMTLGRKDRSANVKGVFKLAKIDFNLENKVVFIVDDVATTLSTINECARTLKSGGARKVFGLVLSRQEA